MTWTGRVEAIDVECHPLDKGSDHQEDPGDGGPDVESFGGEPVILIAG